MLQLVVNYIVVYDFCGFVADIIHSSDPLHLVIRFEFFCHALTLCHLIYEPKNHNRICGMIAKKVRMWYAMKKKPPESRCSTRLSGVGYCRSKNDLSSAGQKFLSCARSYFLLLFLLFAIVFSLNFL